MGLHLKYRTPTELQKAIDNYFDKEDKPTICGLALALGFTSRQTLLNYEERPDFVDIVKRAKMFVEASYEAALRGQYSSGAIFALKNFGWTDKQEVTHDFINALPVNFTIQRNGIK